MLKNLLKNTALHKEIKKLYNKNENIIDIIIFGSSVKEKMRPKDIDILLIFSRKNDTKIVNRLRDILRKFDCKTEITATAYKDLFNSAFLPRENILLEGISLITKKRLSESFGYNSFILFKYDIKKFSETERVKFFYALSGRKKVGMLKECGYRIGQDTLLIMAEKSDEFKEFLDLWGVKYNEFEILLPQRRLFLLKNTR